MYESDYDENKIVKKNENLLFTNIYVPSQSEHINGCSHLLVASLPFQYKLWMVVKLSIYDFIGWNEEGYIVYIDHDGLDSYLGTEKNIFNITSIEIFLDVLVDHGFEQLPHFIDNGRLIHAFKHVLFIRYGKKNLPQIRNLKYSSQEIKMADMNSEERKKALLNQRMAGDLCFMRIGTMSHLEYARLNFAVALQFQRTKEIAKEANKSQAQYHGRKRRWNTYDKVNSSIPEVEIPLGMYENPYESTIDIEKYGHAFDFPGYYSRANANQVRKFYGDLTPKFVTEAKNGLGNRKLR